MTKKKLIDKTRLEFYIPFIPVPEYYKVFNRLIKFFCKWFEGCTVFDKIDGYYQEKNTPAIYPDIINMIAVDVPNKDFSLSTNIELCTTLSEAINDKFGQKVTYFSIGGMIFPDSVD